MAELLGYVLTRQWREQADGLRLIYWVYSDQGPVQVTVTGQETVSFFPAGQVQRVNDLLRGSKAGKGWRLRPLALKSFFNEPVHGLYCSGQRTLAQCRDLFDAHGIPLWEADIRTVDRFLSERFITGDIERGDYEWSINCTDAGGNEGNSTKRTIHVNATLDSDLPVVELYSPADGSLRNFNFILVTVDGYFALFCSNHNSIWVGFIPVNSP